MRLLRQAVVFLTTLLFILGTGCQKRAPTTDVVYIHASSLSALANGSSLDTIYADLPINTLAAYRGVTFAATSGLFANGFDTMSAFALRTDISPNKITAIVVWQAGIRGGLDTLSVATSTVPEYVDYLYLNLDTSVVDSIQFLPAYIVQDSTVIQDSFTAVLRSAIGAKVSMGGTVVFTDITGGKSAGGYFLPPTAIVDSSQVSTVYFPPPLSGAQITNGNIINIQAQAYNAGGVPVGREATVTLVISP
jgi:hypothetical protein